MRRILLIILFSIFTVINIYLTATSEIVAMAFVYVMATLASGFLCTYFALNKNEWQ